METERSCDLDCCLDATLFAALSDPRRLEIVRLLAHTAQTRLTVGEVADQLPIDQSVVSRHLKVLREAGAVDSVRDGRCVTYCLCGPQLSQALRTLADAVDRCCDGSCPCCSTRCESEVSAQ